MSQASQAQLEELDAQIAELRRDNDELKAQVAEGGQDSEDTAAALTNVEENEALLVALQGRRRTLAGEED